MAAHSQTLAFNKKQRMKMPKNTILLQEHIAFDEKILKIYQLCMTLIEEVSHYSENEGRLALTNLAEDAARFYQQEAARMSTRLMQMAAWLLLWQAGRDKEMTATQIAIEKAKISLHTSSENQQSPLWSALPDKFQDYVLRSLSLEGRLRFIDQDISVKCPQDSIVLEQQNRLKAAFR